MKDRHNNDLTRVTISSAIGERVESKICEIDIIEGTDEVGVRWSLNAKVFATSSEIVSISIASRNNTIVSSITLEANKSKIAIFFEPKKMKMS